MQTENMLEEVDIMDSVGIIVHLLDKKNHNDNKENKKDDDGKCVFLHKLHLNQSNIK